MHEPTRTVILEAFQRAGKSALGMTDHLIARNIINPSARKHLAVVIAVMCERVSTADTFQNIRAVEIDRVLAELQASETAPTPSDFAPEFIWPYNVMNQILLTIASTARTTPRNFSELVRVATVGLSQVTEMKDLRPTYDNPRGSATVSEGLRSAVQRLLEQRGYIGPWSFIVQSTDRTIVATIGLGAEVTIWKADIPPHLQPVLISHTRTWVTTAEVNTHLWAAFGDALRERDLALVTAKDHDERMKAISLDLQSS